MTPEHTDLNGPALRRVRLRVAYHGASFHGFARNEGVRTIEGELTSAVATIVRRDVEISTAGRTDAGVHARGQMISCDIPANTNLDALVRGINALCGPHIAVSDGEWMPDDFDARRSATWRSYRYTVFNSPDPNPLLIDRSWHIREPLNLTLMNLACDAMHGEQDFSAFCRRAPHLPGEEPKSLRRYVFEAKWVPGEGPDRESCVEFHVRANAFCHQMVRALVGFCVDVGLKKRPPSDARAVLLAKDRAHGSQVAPPQGLVLWDVGYDGTRIHP